MAKRTTRAAAAHGAPQAKDKGTRSSPPLGTGTGNKSGTSTGPKRDAPWNKPTPKRAGKGVRLSPLALQMAKDRARAAGRPYPNLIDNMWAARHV